MNIALVQYKSKKDFYENNVTLENFIDILSDMNIQILILSGNFSGNINKEEFEDLKEVLSAISEYNDITIIGTIKLNGTLKTLIQVPYNELTVLEKTNYELTMNKKVLNIINPNIKIDEHIKEDKINIISTVILNEEFNNTIIALPENSKININNSQKTGGNLEGYIVFKV
ncbi:hypothetical protein OSSY52_20880 [Tepiditoga spiralis]|uniref:Uncharacterized protein n=1 Tax=Tepiditoga spiralis TaxID=2108365 RepID=A0A7G1GA63_9BACT|nr:hypothetical protein [Tepiditoga spiralis]BBE31947.1 hypothetical protein OSSY52_20880 [Tepiditoga spiralis]